MGVLIVQDVLSMRSVLPLSAAAHLPLPLLAVPPGELWKATARGFEPLRAEPNGFRVHLLSRSDTLSWLCSSSEASDCERQGLHPRRAQESKCKTSRAGCPKHGCAYCARCFVDEKCAVALSSRALAPSSSCCPSWGALESDSEGNRTPAGRAQWISSPSS